MSVIRCEDSTTLTWCSATVSMRLCRNSRRARGSAGDRLVEQEKLGPLGDRQGEGELALRAGASGFLGKGARPDALIEAIRTVARGDSLLSPAATRGLIARYLTLDGRAPQAPPGLVDALTEREREIVALVATGMSNAEIADHLTLSPLTVKTHANHAMTKLGARDRAQLVVLAYQAGLAGQR